MLLAVALGLLGEEARKSAPGPLGLASRREGRQEGGEADGSGRRDVDPVGLDDVGLPPADHWQRPGKR